MGKEANKAQGAPGQDEQRNHVDRAGPVDPSREEAIRKATYDAYLRRGDAPGSETDDWLEGEAQVDRQRSKP